VQTREGDNIIKRLASQGKDARHPRILVFGPSAERYRVSAAFRSGAHGYVLNSCKSDELTTAIRTILGGKTYLSPAAASGFVEGMIDLAGMS